jgi:hypothetical protein
MNTLVPTDPAVRGRETRIAVENLDLVERLLRQAGVHRHHLADEFRSQANWPLGLGPDEERNYAARAILVGFLQVRRDLGRRGRLWKSIEGRLQAGDEPPSREVAPDAMAELRESLALGLIAPPPAYRSLSGEQAGRLRALIAADPARSNSAIARDFFTATHLRVHASAVGYHRRRLGLPASQSSGGAHMHWRKQAQP